MISAGIPYAVPLRGMRKRMSQLSGSYHKAQERAAPFFVTVPREPNKYPLVKEYTLNQNIKAPIVQDIFRN